MTLERFLLCYLILHGIVCLLIYIGIRTRFLKFTEQLFPMVVLVPVVGVVLALIADYHSRFRRVGIRPIDLEELHLGDSDLRLKRLEDDPGGETVLPLEEAMSINDAGVRRQLMLDILHQNPQEYVELLREARMDEDIEVTHYASTAMMEMQRDYELSLQRAEKEYATDPEDGGKLDRYLYCLKRYLDSGLIEEHIQFVYRSQYADLLKKKREREPEDMSAGLLSVDNALALSHFTEAKALSDELIARWPQREEAWFTRLKLCRQMNDGPGIKDTVAQIKDRGVYLTPQGRATLAFWDADSRKEETT